MTDKNKPASALREPAEAIRKVLTEAETATLVAELEKREGYKVLRQLRPLSLYRCNPNDGLKCAIIVDTESTGVVMPGAEAGEVPHSEIVSLAMVSVAYDPTDGAVKGAVGRLHRLHQPSHPIPAAATAIHGITDEMVSGKFITENEVADFIALSAASVQTNTVFGSRNIEKLPLIIAHNAHFDRQLMEYHFPSIFRDLPWACSQSEVPWAQYGFEGLKLFYLAFKASFYFGERHTAMADADAVVELLRQPLDDRSAMALLCEAARRPTYSLSVVSRYDPAVIMALKGRGYRWREGGHGKTRAWSWQGDKSGLAQELAFLDRSNLETSRMIKEHDPFDRFSIRDR